ncbi:hypothetical protein [Prosthecobacter vanneervenii]|uniref:Uncharacterized protein n=1 Tax=Prosthecobacter vanneervenii TaxID=48466 RepID=A0A7W8DKC6_9BACT|nr:hypothetical protein [Prosthecobacter vanneervenii]MBB5033094.1 hypothetical protein [Prosthecobacter vanneervenii]
MFIIPAQRTSTMNSSHVYPQTKTPGTGSTHLGFYEVHQHLDEDLHLADDMSRDADARPVHKSAAGLQPNAKVLFQFFDGWSMVHS